LNERLVAKNEGARGHEEEVRRTDLPNPIQSASGQDRVTRHIQQGQTLVSAPHSSHSEEEMEQNFLSLDHKFRFPEFLLSKISFQ
jgi:hypothetical protein